MEVINKPGIAKGDEAGGADFNPPPPESPNQGGGDNRPDRPPRRKSKGVVLLRKTAFVLCGAMFGVAIIFTAFTVIVASGDPVLAPNVQDNSLHQDKVYIKFDDEDFYRELIIIRDEIADPEPQEVTQIAVGRSFKLVFTPKQMDIPENYRIIYREVARTADNVAVEKNLDRKAGRDKEGGFDVLTITAHDGKWPTGRFLIMFPEGGMFGGKLYAYFTVNEAPKPGN